MSRAIWLIMYDVAPADERTYLDWFHGVHIPEKLARPGYEWAAHYELVAPDGQPVGVEGSVVEDGKRGYLALFGGADTRTFLDPSPAQIKPKQPPLTREMMGLRHSSRSLIAAEEWRVSEAHDVQPSDCAYLHVVACDVGDGDEEYGAWCAQVLAPALRAAPGFEAGMKLLSTTEAAKHLIVAGFGSLAALEGFRLRADQDDWSQRIRGSQIHSAGSPMLARRVWPHA